MNLDIDGIDADDWKILLTNILRNAMDDYIKLQHPLHRDKTYLQEAFETAVEMLFDDDYRMQYVQDYEDQDMSLQNLLNEVLITEDVKVEKLRDFMVLAAKEHWEHKEMNTINVPNMFVVEGHVFTVIDKYGEYEVDYDEKELYIDLESLNVEQEFVIALCEILCDRLDSKISKRNREDIARGLYRTLKVNGAFQEVTATE